MKTHLQKIWPLILVFRFVGIVAFIAGMLNLLGVGKAEWKENIILGLGWLILAAIEENTSRTKDMAKADKNEIANG